MRSPGDYLTVGLIMFGVSLLPFYLSLVEDDAAAFTLLAAGLWFIAGLFLSVGVIGWGVRLGLRARDDELAEEKRQAARAKKAAVKKS